MVLEDIVTDRMARKHPIDLLFVSILMSSIAIWGSYYIFKETTSILSLAFITMGLMPLIHSIFVEEEEEEAEEQGPAAAFLARHFDIIKILSWFFLGLVLSYAFWYATLPTDKEQLCLGDTCFPAPLRQKVFAEQEKTYNFIAGKVTGLDAAAAGNATRESCLGKARDLWGCTEFIYANNAIVLGLAILFSFVWGAGTLFLLGWNASVIGVFIGKELQENGLVSGILKAFGYIPHGLPEVLAYFIGSIAGGIISVFITKKKYQLHEPQQIVKDVLFLLLLAYLVLFLGAVVEAYFIVQGA
ncbi:MAG: stage II sporulation protein M [Candidatus Diapherotrites archaeon]|uniref:Stage II sporulation protein M n=1 Tax=Candidatus Iainarchaeum sp. TaxID=3101447 RepID=A0A8T4L566_9ARCH|nr:stage II sporulation protein M [Candidatus Diapherotrites archaeon]